MTTGRRWLLVAVGFALLIGTPLAVRALPANDADIGARMLLEQVEGSADAPYSGYVETRGTLQLPVSDSFTDVGALFGERTRMRVWWRSSEDWRVDKVLTTGETDLFHDAGGTTTWEYEKSLITRTGDPRIRLPRTSDLLPPELAGRLLEDVEVDELSRLPAEKVAGRDAQGLRLVPGAPQSSIDHVDLWVDPASGHALSVAVYAKGEETAAFTSTFMTFSDDIPSSAHTGVSSPPGAEFDYEDVLDIADVANQYAPFTPPRTLAGLESSADAQLRGVGVYGRGITQMIAIPLWGEAAEPLREQMQITFGTRQVDEGHVLTVGPLGILLTGVPDDEGGWLVAGPVTEQTLRRAARDVERSQAGLR